MILYYIVHTELEYYFLRRAVISLAAITTFGRVRGPGHRVGMQCSAQKPCGLDPTQTLSEATYLGHEVAESDGRHGYEDEIERFRESPSLLEAEHDGADDDVHHEHDKRHRDGQVELVVDRVHAECRRAGRSRRKSGLAVRHAAEHVAGPPELGDVVHHLHALHDLLQ